jgi:hypothetical protein
VLKISIKGLRNLNAALDAHTRDSKRALKTAIKVEGFRQLRQLREEIRAGRPGGRPYAAQLSEIARRTKTGREKKNQIPLYKLARLLRYQVEYGRDGDISLSFGFVNSPGRPLTGSWKSLLIKHQEGTDVLHRGSRTELGRRFARIGGRLKKKNDPDAKFFFLRKTTGRRIDLPKRPMIDPYWNTHKDEALVNIRKNFARKMRGERI